MLEIVAKAIDQFYIKKDYSTFKADCKKQLKLFDELKHYIESHKLVLIEMCDTNSPSRDWHIKFEDYKQGEFEVSYTTLLRICKVAQLFYIHHEFSVRNKSKNRLDPVLDGFGGQPYIIPQMELYDEITSILNKKGYQELSNRDLDETVEGFKMPENTIFWS